MKTRIVLLAAFVVTVAGCTGTSDDASPTTPETTVAAEPAPASTSVLDPGGPVGPEAAFTETDCPVDPPPNVVCGYVTVPEDWQDPASATIDLAVAISVVDGDPVGPPVVYLAGGPGGSALSDFFDDLEGWNVAYLEGRDLVLVDQRGTGYSEPTLNCPEMEVETANADDERACFDRLVDAGIDLTAYTTRQNAADIAAVRVALDIPEWDLLGISYGTRLALDVMRHHPEGVRAAILDSPFPPNADTPEAETLSFVWSFERLVAECTADAYCAETYPDLEDTLLDVVVSYNEDPGEITGDDIVVGIGQAFADTSAIGLIPWTIYELRDGNEDALFELTGQEWSRRFQSDDVTDSEGMYNSVICADEYTTGDFERIEAAVVGEIPPELESALLQPVFELTNLCSYWHPRVSVDDSPVVSDIPALVLVGGYDTATPPLWGELTVQTLSNGYLVEIPGSGHNVLNEACPIEIATQFLDDPFTRPDTACLASIDWPYFE